MLRQRAIAVSIVLLFLGGLFFALSAQASAPPALGNASSTTHGHESSTSDDKDHASTTDDKDHATTTDDKDHPTTDDRDVTTTDDKDHHPSTTDDKDHHPSTTDDRDHHPTTTCPEPDREDKDHPATTDDHGSAENAHPPSSHEQPDTTHDDGDHVTTDDRDHHPTTTDDKDHKPPEDCEQPPHHTQPPTTHTTPTFPPVTTVVTFPPPPPLPETFSFGGATTVCRAEVPTIVIDFSTPGFPSIAGRPGTLTMSDLNGNVVSTQTVIYEPGGHVELLYPGTTVNPDGTIADVPGWILTNAGLWVRDPSDEFLRAGIHLSYTVNPTAETTVTYPPESSICANPENPPGTPGAPGGPGIPPAL